MIKVANVSTITPGDMLTVGTGQRLERVKVVAVGTPGADGTGVTLAAPLKFDNMAGVDVAGPGTGISFTPATRFAHSSGDAVQALGSGITLDRPLARAHALRRAAGQPAGIDRRATRGRGPTSGSAASSRSGADRSR